MAKPCKHGYGNPQICPKCYEATIVEPLSDEEIKAYPPIAELMKGNSYLQEKGRFLATIAADRKRIEELEKINKVHRDLRPDETGVLHIIKLKEDIARQTTTIERREGEIKERDNLLTEVVKMDLDVQIKKTIADFYERQYQGPKHERVIPIIIKCDKCGFRFTPGADEHCPQCQALDGKEK